MDAGDLRVFEAVARLGGMNRAAQELNTVQSNVTGHIRALEAEPRTVLFHRHPRGVSLTASGQRLLPYAARVRRLLDDATRAARDDGAPAGPLIIGSLETTAALRVSPMLARYATAYPEVDLSLRTGTTCELIDDVLAHRVDGAFVCGPVVHPDLLSLPAFQEELVAITAPGVTFESILATGGLRIIVLRAGCSYRQRLESLLAKRGIVRPRVLEFGTLEAILACTGAGLGVTLLPRGLAEDARRTDQVAAHTLPPEEAMVETVFIRRHDGYVSSALSAFLDLAQSMQPPMRAAA